MSLGFDAETWPVVLDTLTEKLKKINLPHQINNIKTFEGKVSKARENITIRQKIATYISKCSEVHHFKNGTAASRLRDQGNEKFKRKDNAGALKLYTESIICAPEYGPELSLAYGNRSAALFHCGEYRAALDDVQMALKCKYPKNIEYKILQRKAQCLLRLGSYAEAVEVLNSCQAGVDAAKLSDEKKISVMKDVNAMVLELEGLLNRTNSTERDQTNDPSPLFVNSSLPNASPKLALKSSEEKIKGRFVITSQSIEEGELLFSEEPYSSVLLPEQYSTHCHHCYRKLEAPMPCKKCTQPRYCSNACVEEGWQEYHQYECGQLDLLHSIGIGHLAVRTVLVTGLEKLVNIKQSIKGENFEYSNDDEYSRVFSLTHHVDKMQYTVTAALLATFLTKKSKFIFPTKSPSQQTEDDTDEDLVNYIGGLVLRHLCQLVGNAHAITELRESENGDVQQVRLATAIYPSASMMNHSCVTTIINQFKGRRLLVRATRSLQPGDQVTNCYGPHYRRHAYQERQDMLLNQYKFRCMCEACADLKERNFMKKFEARRCNFCDGSVIDETCTTCDKQMKTSEDYDAEIDGIVGELLNCGIQDTPGERNRIQRLEKSERRLSNILYKHNSHLARVRDMLARAYSDEGEYSLAAELTRKCLGTVSERYGTKSIEVGHELLKYTDLVFAQLNNGEQLDPILLIQSLTEARDIFALNYGENCKFVAELNQKLSLLNQP
ncbi:SET and MYND domain-containing protein 4 isoform X2 [Eurytemora carolleeae]|uniref:SET and MYND domain-containing protein 4 isoform X2 n=1 Tax=Eurytemora carolleeae TaxID=1294199 RepID=UPI000C766301|nr:SET and MYND domain-containing protein 4 isoform X2 [Eurytemora carolleeae]|eukprot:XP_023343918.1 SET and MYND domain-containing protein 4-like isoform X2 [Eurytemora affinis]